MLICKESLLCGGSAVDEEPRTCSDVLLGQEESMREAHIKPASAWAETRASQ